jgi:predicted enzyme related to lactoylglutathione lyase
MTAYGDGVPSWIDLSSPDLDASKAFYTALFGWEALPPVPEAGGYTQLTLRGKLVAGMGPVMSPGQPPAWMTYVNESDADGTVKRVIDAGGTVVMQPMDVMSQGRMAIVADPAGAVIGIWQPALHTGAQLVGEPGAYCWSELATRDPERATAFYGAAFEWEASADLMGPMQYTEFKVDGQSIAGMFPIGDTMPADMPSYWGVYIAVADCDGAVAMATSLGATIVTAAMDIPIGRFAGLRDPQGAYFSVIQLAQA